MPVRRRTTVHVGVASSCQSNDSNTKDIQLLISMSSGFLLVFWSRFDTRLKIETMRLTDHWCRDQDVSVTVRIVASVSHVCFIRLR